MRIEKKRVKTIKISIKMENTNETGGEKKDLFIRLKIKKSGQCETRPEICNRLAMACVEVSEERNETEESLELSIHLQSQSKVSVVQPDKTV